jgi:hypothetical protein
MNLLLTLSLCITAENVDRAMSILKETLGKVC